MTTTPGAWQPTPDPSSVSCGRRLLWPLLGIAYVLRVYVGLFWPTIYWADDIFLIPEQSHRLWFGYGIIPWEWRVGIRSWLIPGILAPIIGIAELWGFDPPGYAGIVAALMSVVSLSIVVVGFRFGARHFGVPGAMVVGSLCAVWFEFIYFAAKPAAEVIAAHILVIASWIICTSPDRLRCIGVLLGIVFIVRFHTAPMLLLAAVWVCGWDVRQRWIKLASGAAIPILMQATLDWITLGSPLQSIWLYFWIAIVEHRAAEFGVMPFYWYPGRLLVIWGPVLPVVIVAAAAGARRAPLLAWMVGVHLLAHSLIDHKEERFLYPAMPLLIILVGLGVCDYLSRWATFARAPRLVTAVAVLALTMLSAAGAANPGFVGNWTKMAGSLRATDFLRDRADLCGVALVSGPQWPGYWSPSGGYYRLHRDVPIYIAPDGSRLTELAAHFNYASVPAPVGDALAGYERLQCWPGGMGSGKASDAPAWCVYRRAGPCDENAGAKINKVLTDLDQ